MTKNNVVSVVRDEEVRPVNLLVAGSHVPTVQEDVFQLIDGVVDEFGERRGEAVAYLCQLDSPFESAGTLSNNNHLPEPTERVLWGLAGDLAADEEAEGAALSHLLDLDRETREDGWFAAAMRRNRRYFNRVRPDRCDDQLLGDESLCGVLALRQAQRDCGSYLLAHAN